MVHAYFFVITNVFIYIACQFSRAFIFPLSCSISSPLYWSLCLLSRWGKLLLYEHFVLLGMYMLMVSLFPRAYPSCLSRCFTVESLACMVSVALLCLCVYQGWVSFFVFQISVFGEMTVTYIYCLFPHSWNSRLFVRCCPSWLLFYAFFVLLLYFLHCVNTYNVLFGGNRYLYKMSHSLTSEILACSLGWFSSYLFFMLLWYFLHFVHNDNVLCGGNCYVYKTSHPPRLKFLPACFSRLCSVSS